MPNEFEGVVEVCCHRVSFRYWDLTFELTEELADILMEEAERRALEMIVDGYYSGELNCFYSDGTVEDEIRGYWEIENS